MAKTTGIRQETGSSLAGPPVNQGFATVLNELVEVARQGYGSDSHFLNPSNQWLISHMRIFQDLPQAEQEVILQEARQLAHESQRANAAGKAASRVWPDVAFRLDTGGLAFFSQLGVVRRPDLTYYFIDGFLKNRDALAFSGPNQVLFTQVFKHITRHMRHHFASGEGIIQTDRQIADAPGRSFHARQLLFGAHYPQVPYMWRQLTFDLPEEERSTPPNILEISIPSWLDDLDLPEELKDRIGAAGLSQLIFKAPSKGLSLHLGFDYLGEHKMGPLSIAMFLVKAAGGLAIQAALSLARAKTLEDRMVNTAMVTVGPSLHGKSTLTVMIDLSKSSLPERIGLIRPPDEGVYPMNDDIVLLQRVQKVVEATHGGGRVRISHGIDGTENNFYAVPFGLTQEDDPVTYQALRGSLEAPNSEEAVENVPVDAKAGTPNFMENPVRNMRVILSRQRLLDAKKAQHLLAIITRGRMVDSVHIPLEETDQIFWQAVMRQNTVIPPLRRVSLEQYVRVLMYGEAVQMGAAAGAIGRPYVEYFSDPFIIGLEDENADALFNILREMARGGLRQHCYVFNTGGVGAENNEEATGPKYKKISRELTLMLQEALLRGAVKFEYDAAMNADVAVAVIKKNGEELVDLRAEWLPRFIYGEAEYHRRVVELKRRRYYGRDSRDKAGILRYTKVMDALVDVNDIPQPASERELAWLLSFYWHVDQPYDSLSELAQHLGEGRRPTPDAFKALRQMYQAGVNQGLNLPASSQDHSRMLLGSDTDGE